MIAGIVPGYSGGSVPDLHRVPSSALLRAPERKKSQRTKSLAHLPQKHNIPDRWMSIRDAQFIARMDSSPVEGPRNRDDRFQAGLLASGSTENSAFPSFLTVACCRLRPRLQRRARPRIARGSLFGSTFEHLNRGYPITFRRCVSRKIRQENSTWNMLLPDVMDSQKVSISRFSSNAGLPAGGRVVFCEAAETCLKQPEIVGSGGRASSVLD